MTQRISFTFLTLLFSFVFAQITLADTFTASVQNLAPGNSVLAKNKVTFNVTTSGFQAQTYQISDSFGVSSVANTNFDGGGNFQWVPLVSDVGTHNLTITARDFNGNSAVTQLALTVLPPPSVTISSVSSSAISAGQKLTFVVSQTGFTNPAYVLGDSFSGSSVGNQNIDTSGNFSWTPDLSQNGKHTITVYATDSQGHGAQASIDVQVGAGPTLLIQIVTPGTTINAGTTVSFNVGAVNFLPTNFAVTDAFAGSSITNANINTSGNFVWTPSGSDVGTHVLTFKGQIGAFGDSATTSQTLYVVGTGVSTTTPPVIAQTTASSSTLLSALQAQLAALMAKTAGLSSSNATSPVVTSILFDTYLKPGSEGDQVTALQNILIKEGYLKGEATGHYGQQTVDAVIKFQAAHGLTQLGVVGPATRALLNKMAGSDTASTVTTSSAKGDGFVFEHFMGYGDDDPDVLELQQRLSALGFLKAAPTGFYGNGTVSAVKKYQKAHDLPQVGYVDKATRAELNK